MRMSAYDREGRLASLAARHFFLQAISAHAPEVVEQLADRPYKAAMALWLKREESPVAAEFFDHDWWEDLRLATDRMRPALLPLKESLLEWGARFHLTEDWCYETALTTVRTWVESPTTYEGREWRTGGAGGMDDIEFRFRHAPTFETRESAHRRFRRELREFYEIEIPKRAAELGLQRTRKTPKPEHLEWLVKFQVLEMSWADIWYKDHSTGSKRDNILKSARRAAELIGLTLREAEDDAPS